MKIFIALYLISSYLCYASLDDEHFTTESKPLRITIVTDTYRPTINGVTIVLEETKKALEELGHYVTMITPQSFYSVPYLLDPAIRISITWPSTVSKMIEESKPDALHIATESTLGIMARIYANSNKLKFTSSYHTCIPEYLKIHLGVPLSWTYAILRWFHNSAIRTMVPTQSMRELLLSWNFNHIDLWSHGVDLETFTKSPNASPTLKIPEKTQPVFLYAGRVATEKNIEAFLDLDLPGTKWIVGDGPHLKTLKHKYESKNIYWAGMIRSRSELAHFYAAADVFVFPSKTDTFALVILEAMACGCPVAAYPVTGPIDILGDSPIGALDDDLGTACLKALTINRKAVRAYAEQFTWAKTTAQFLENLSINQTGKDKIA